MSGDYTQPTPGAAGGANPAEEGPETDLDEAEYDEESISLMEADSTIKNYVIAAMALGLVPVPVFDIVAIVAVQLKMIHALTRIYGITFTENVAKSLVLSLIGGILPVTAAASLASMIKVFPFAGSLIGGASVCILAGALTYAVGKVFVQHFESGGTLLDFSPSKVRERFRNEFARGKDVAADLEGEAKEEAGKTG